MLTEGHSPHVTSDGRLVFSRSGSGPRTSGSLWVARLADGGSGLSGEPVRVLEGARTNWYHAAYAVADNGTVAYLPPEDREPYELVWAERDGETETILDARSPQLPAEAGSFMATRISPDGSRLAFRATFSRQPNFRLFVLDLGRRSLHRVSVDVNADWPVWTPDGERLAFNRFTGDEQNLYWARADNTDEPEPMLPPNNRQQHPGSFTPDGELLILQDRPYRQAPDSDIRALSVDGSGDLRPVLETPAFEIQPSLSLDGRWLAYASDESGQLEVYVTDFPGRTTRVKISTEEAWQPAWSPTGRELFYRRRSPSDALIAVEVDASGSSFRAGAPALLFEGSFETCCPWGRSYDVAPDGNRFLMVRREVVENAPRIRIIQNWQVLAGRDGRD